VEKVAQKFGLGFLLFEKVPNENNYPAGEISLNLVTLMVHEYLELMPPEVIVGQSLESVANFRRRNFSGAVPTSSARWKISVPKIAILENFGVPWNRKFWYIYRSFGIFCS
jgi:hypothetical protein